MGEERSTVTVSPLVRERSGGMLWSLSCSESSFTWYLLLAVGGMLGGKREFNKGCRLLATATDKVRKLSRSGVSDQN